jgi:Cytochrome P460
MKRDPRVVATIAVLLVGMLTFTAGQSPPADQSQATPRYSQSGELVRPERYRGWVFCGADLGLAYGDEAAGAPGEIAPVKDEDSFEFHNVYIDRVAYEAYARTKRFPDRTVLVMERFQSKQKEPQHIVSRGHYEAERVGLEVAVKNSARPDGSKTAWAYYSFTNPRAPTAPPLATARALPDAKCYDCHLKHADDDNVWVQFYPALRDRKGR